MILSGTTQEDLHSHWPINPEMDLRTDLGLAMFARIAEEQKKGEYRVETYYSLSTSAGNENQEHSIGGELWTVRERAAIIALDLLRKYLLKVTQSA